MITCYCRILPGRHFPSACAVWSIHRSLGEIPNPDKGKGQDIFIYLDRRCLGLPCPQVTRNRSCITGTGCSSFFSHHNCVLRHNFPEHSLSDMMLAGWRVRLPMFSPLPSPLIIMVNFVISFEIYKSSTGRNKGVFTYVANFLCVTVEKYKHFLKILLHISRLE